MPNYYLITGSSASGKSTVDRNLRLRAAEEFSTGVTQEVGEVLFCGRILFRNGKRVLRLSGGDATSWEVLLRAHIYYPQARCIFFERAHFPDYVCEEIVSLGTVTMFHLLVTPHEARDRLRRLRHPSAERLKGHPEGMFHAYAPLYPEYLEKRDAKMADLGIQVVYVDGTLQERCRFIEETADYPILRDAVVYDFQVPVVQIISHFKEGGDVSRP